MLSYIYLTSLATAEQKVTIQMKAIMGVVKKFNALLT